MIPPTFVHELLARVDIVDIVGRHVQLKKAGINHKGLCPFHGEKSPSFIVSPTRQTYHCFGCGVHGNALGFLMEHSGVGFIDAVRDLAQQTGMLVPEDDSSPAERERASAQKQRQATLTDVLAKAAEHYRRQLKASPRAVSYLKGRGLNGEIAAHFGLGYAPEGWRGLASVFPSYDDPLLEDSGMVIAKPADGNALAGGLGEISQALGRPSEIDGSGETPDRQASASAAMVRRYDRFRDRIMFPIRSVQGEVIGFGGRVLDRGEPKYLNSPETPVFSKGQELYGLHEARVGLRQRGYALVVEGYMDVVALAQSGFNNAVATLGTACTAEHVKKLFRFTESVVFSFDGDGAGRRAAGRALEASLGHATDTRSVRFLFLPPEHDPDSYVREMGAAAFEACVAAAVPLSRQLVEMASDGCDLGSAEGRAKLVAQARPLVAQLPEGLLRGQIVEALAGIVHIDASEMRERWGPATGRDRDRDRDIDRAQHHAGNQRPRGRDTLPRLSPRRPVATMASTLDRAVWLLVHRADLWERLGHEAHDLLSGQPSPHGEFFAWLDRLLHDQGALAPAAVMAEMNSAEAPAALVSLARRVADFHEVEAADGAAVELGVILDRLRLQRISAELELLSESDGLSDVARQRQRDLYARQAEFKQRLARPAFDSR